jgi:hypothetical protein
MSDDIEVVPEDYKSSHKFGHSPLAEALWVESLQGFHTEEAGSVDTIGWYALFHFEQAKEIKFFDEHPDSGEVSPVVTVPVGSYILSSDSVGFVYVDSYSLRGSEVSEDWRKILAAESDAWDEEDGDHNYAD